jgi:hypothetical protein
MSNPPSEAIFRHLVRYLGQHTTRTALRTFCSKAVGKAPDAVTRAEIPQVLLALRPMMRTLIGAQESDTVIGLVNKELGL